MQKINLDTHAHARAHASITHTHTFTQSTKYQPFSRLYLIKDPNKYFLYLFHLFPDINELFKNFKFEKWWSSDGLDKIADTISIYIDTISRYILPYQNICHFIVSGGPSFMKLQWPWNHYLSDWCFVFPGLVTRALTDIKIRCCSKVTWPYHNEVIYIG